MKQIILCADDYGQNAAISQGIIELFHLNRLSATSCLTNFPDWKFNAHALRYFKGIKQLGLHLNLSEGYSLIDGKPLPSLPQLLFKSCSRMLSEEKILQELLAQLDAFENHLGFLPNFIDGHQHIHHFPVVRDALIKLYEEKLRPHHIYIRQVHGRPFSSLKHWMIHYSGADHFKKMLVEKNIPHNASFSGIYSFHPKIKYHELFPTFLKNISHQGLIMCHPSLAPRDAHDKIAQARLSEYQYFSSNQFLKDCFEANIEIL